MRRIDRNIAVDRLRGIAILMVLGLHFFGFWAYVHDGEQNLRGIYKVFGHGFLGVNIFFTISGYLIASTAVARKPDQSVSIVARSFYIRRATRILPLLALTLAIGASAVAAVPTGPSREYLFEMPGVVLSAGFWLSVIGFAFNWFRLGAAGSGGVHGWFGLQWDVLWSLAVEEQFYAVFPLVIMKVGTVGRLRGLLWTVFVVAVATRASLAASGADWLTSATNSLSCFDALSLGVLVAISDPWSPRRSRLAAGLGCAGLLLCYLLGYVGWGLPATGIAAATAAIIQASRTPGTFPRLPLPWIGSIGVLSYGLYLLQALAFALLPTAVLQLNPFLGLAIALGVAIALAWVSFVLFEQPVERFLRGKALAWLAGRHASSA